MARTSKAFTADDVAESPRSNVRESLKSLLLCAVYIGVSTLLIRFNKMLMSGPFPYAIALSSLHMLTSSFLCGLLYLVVPSAFPSMGAIKGERLNLMRWFLPISACFAVMLCGSNAAYAHCSVALLQFMKEANVMCVFVISCIVGLQTLTRVRGVLIVWVLVGSMISVSGDIRFSTIGVVFQAVSQLAECSRMVMGEILLQGRRLDPLTYTAFVAPTSFLVLLFANFLHWEEGTLTALANSWRLLLLNCTVAFILNLLVAAVIKATSAVGFVFTGLVKDIVIVVLSSAFFLEPISPMQWAAFMVTLAGVGLWSLLKISPQSAPVQILESLLCIPRASAVEKAPLIKSKV